MKKVTFLFAIVIGFCSFQSIFAQEEPKFDFYSRGSYRTEVPRPQSILRFDVGDHHTTYAQMEQVVYSIEKAASDRVKIYDIGLTNENRMQHIVAISSPENMARIDQIRANVARLSDPRSTSPSEAAQIAENTPAIAWMAYTIHGNESASFETMMQVIYQLAASNEPKTLEILNNTVVLVITGENPDGHERFVTWYNSVAVGDPNPAAMEHREPWSIMGRYNHYRFDLNRDNIATTQKETKNMQKAYLEWNPQVSVDHHGQPSQFFFPPAALPINPNLPQPVTNKWLDMFGRGNAAEFDARRWDYYVRDIFDLFYPGYWDTFPSLNGAIGMTYETDGGGFKGLKWRRDDGTIVTLRSAIAKHYVASLATLEVLSDNKTQRLVDFYQFRKKALDDYAKEQLKRIVIIPDKDPVKAAEMIEILRNARVEVKVASSSFSSTRAHSYMEKNSPAVSKTFQPGAYVIDLNQPQRLWIKSLMEQDTPQDKEFIDDNMARFRRNELRGNSNSKEGYGFYDITAWNLPLAFGVDAFWTEDAGSFTGNAVTDEYIKQMKTGSVSGRAQIAYIIPYNTDGAGVMALRLAQRGFRVSVTSRPLNSAGRNWESGTFVIRISRNPDSVHDAVSELARELGVRVTAVNTGYNDEGDTGVGGENVISLKSPKIAMVGDEGIDQTSYGSIWWTFDRYGIKFTPMSMNAVRGGALKDYNVLIMPDGSAGRYFASLGSGGVSTLKNWVQEGGTIITVRGASVFAALKDVGLTSTKLVGSSDDEQKGKTDGNSEAKEPAPTPTPESDKADGIAPVLPPIASPSANAGAVPEGIPGAIMRGTVDRTNYLTYGMTENELPVLLASGYFFRISKEGTNAIIFDPNPKKPLTISGFVWEGNTERLLKGTSYLIDEPIGGGHVILFAEEPFYRGIFRSMTRPFINSMLFNGAF
ncbi:MAG: hypothetical protein KIS76_08905 [Pyrinomonadaceae bacterium]|nr:hypothetical protein [Pyrinomonadaceae bacterium]